MVRNTLLAVTAAIVLLVGPGQAGVALDARSAAAGVAAGESPPGLYTFDASTRALKQLIEGKEEYERVDLEWAPDGRWIASTDTEDFLVDVIPADGGTTREVVSILWSPSGSKVAFSTAQGLLVGPSDWSRTHLVARGPGNDALDWAADGGRLAFGSGRTTSCCWHSLGVSLENGSQVRTLWTPPSDGPGASWIDYAAWSPNGRNLAIAAIVNNGVARRKGGEFLYVVTPPRRGAKKVTYRPSGALRAWSRDGKWLIVEESDSLFRVHPAGGLAQALCPTSCGHTGSVLSPDRRRFAYVTSGVLWVANIDGSGKLRIGSVTEPSDILWSPDGRRLALTLRQPDGEHSSIAVADLATRRIQQLTDGSSKDYLGPRFRGAGFSSDGSLVAFFRDEDPRESLWVVSANGGDPYNVMELASGDLGSCPEAAWSPTAPVLAIANAACAPS